MSGATSLVVWMIPAQRQMVAARSPTVTVSSVVPARYKQHGTRPPHGVTGVRVDENAIMPKNHRPTTTPLTWRLSNTALTHVIRVDHARDKTLIHYVAELGGVSCGAVAPRLGQHPGSARSPAGRAPFRGSPRRAA